MQPQHPPENVFLNFVNSIPPITRALFVLLIATFFAVLFNVVNQYDLFFTPTLAFKKLQLWRLFTTFTFIGTDLLSVVFTLFTLYRTAITLEQQSYQGRPEDMLWMLLIGISIFLVAGWIFVIPFLFHSLFFYLLYIWSRRNPRQAVNFLFIPMPAPYLPYVMVLVNFAMGGSVLPMIIGLLVGHVYYYFADVLPVQTGRIYIATPLLLKDLFRHGHEQPPRMPRFGQGHRLGVE
ncbi:hypothetical protein RCL1_006443 [Eukaryota sp. TZLM3-RCL]